MISVICPFFNESAIIEGAIKHMLEQLERLPEDWELICVNDGSTDGSLALAEPLMAGSPRLRVIGYPNNQGRGYALRTGIQSARGDIVVTTEIDCSWGDDIVQRIAQVLHDDATVDMVIASPNLPGGGYRNVPALRVLVSRVGNSILQAGQSSRLTMYTGMTRGYRRDKFLQLPLDEKEKEFHLEVARKAQAFGFAIVEIPALLEWKDHKFADAASGKRTSKHHLPKLMKTHLLFSLAAAPYRYIFPLGLLVGALALVFLVWGVFRLFIGEPSIFLALLSVSLFLFSFLIFAIGVLTYQNLHQLQELWRLRSEIQQARTGAAHPGREAQTEAGDAPAHESKP